MDRSDEEASDQSEFNSDAEEIEFGLYASLYFEPNPDFAPAQNLTTTIKNGNQNENNSKNEHKHPEVISESNINVENILDDVPKYDRQTKKDLIDTKVDNEQSQDMLTRNDDYDKEELANEKCIFGEKQRLRQDNDQIKQNFQNTNEKIHNKENIGGKKYRQDESNIWKQDQEVLSGDEEMEKRVRQSSICSVDSISGHTKLDSLYTMNFSSSDEDEDDYQQELNSKLAINSLILKDKKKEKISLISKRKRGMNESNESESDDDDDEDSKCHIMNKAVKKKKLGENSATVNKETVSSDSDSDIYVLPPSPKQFETLDLASETESEPHKTAIVESIEGSAPKIVSRSGLESSKKLSRQLLKSKNLKCKSTEIPKKGMILSIDDFTSKDIPKKKNKQTKKSSKSKDCITISEEDSDDSIDIAEISQGTDLVMNLGGGLNSFIERPHIEKNKEKKKSERGLLSSVTSSKNRYADYTKDRQVTTKIPSCIKWTPEMATFYDSDISEDLEIEEVHAQQSDSPLLWNIISRDYPIKGRRRYFNQEVRCKRCRQFGHEEKSCPRVPRCHLCSGTDHVVRYQCPNNCCFRCGEEPHAFCRNTLNTTICELCGWPGHNTNLCPDLWRRFHNTTSGSDPCAPVLLGNILRPRSEAYCYCCGGKGHFGHECPERQQIRSCVPVSQSVVSYAPPVLEYNGKKVINFDGCDGPLEEEPYNPVTKIKIKMKDGGRIVGKSGVIVKDIERRTGAKVNIETKKGKQMVCVYGSEEAREAAKNLVEVLVGKRSPDGLENFVIHIARINNDPSVLSLLKKYQGPHGDVYPKVIKKSSNEFSPMEISKSNVQKAQVINERNLFNETPRKRLGDDDSLKQDYLSLIPNSVPSLIREEKESNPLNIDNSPYTDARNLITLRKNQNQSAQLSQDVSLQKDFLSLNTSNNTKFRDEEARSLNISNSPYTDVRNLITQKRNERQTIQMSQDTSLQKDFLSLNTPKKLKLRDDDDIQILKSNVNKRNKPKELNNETDYLVEYLTDESNSDIEHQNIPQATNPSGNNSKLVEEIDNLGIQCTFMKGLKQDFPRNKRLLLEKTQDLLARIDSMDNRIQPIVNKIKNNRKIFKQPNPSLQHKKWLKKNLQALSMVVVGQEKLGSGANLRMNLESLLKDVKASKGKASPELVKEISKTFKKICDPSVKQIDEMLNLANVFMQKYPQGKSSITAYTANSKKTNKKLKAVEKELKSFNKKRINEKGKLNKLKSPNSRKNKSKDKVNSFGEFGNITRKNIDLNKRPKKNKKKKLKVRTKDGKRNWNAVFANS